MKDKMTFEEFQASKKSNLTGLLKKAEGRKVEEVKGKNLEQSLSEKVKVETIAHNLKGNELYNAGLNKNENADLLNF